MSSNEKQYVIHVLSNTHWDREWYMTNEQFMVRLVPMMDSLLDIMEKYPAYRFVLDGQYMALRDYLSARPEKGEQVGRFMREERLLVGPWYTQPLETIASAEGLIRNLQQGIRSTEKYGPAMMTSYEIDQFGHCSQIPQILNGFGIDSVITWRGIPLGSKSVFQWESPDGSKVWMMYSNAGYGEATTLPLGEEDFEETIDGKVYKRRGLKRRISDLRDFREPYSDTVHILWLNGIDHSFAQENLFEVLEKAKKIDEQIEIFQSTPAELFADIKNDFAERNLELETIKGELMYEGEPIIVPVHSCRASQKILHYQTEHYLDRCLEPLTAMSWLTGLDYPKWAVDRAWQFVLENHAHDSLGCTAVDAVYHQVMARYENALALAKDVAQDSMRAVMECDSENEKPSVWFFNTAAFPHHGVAEVELTVMEGMCSDNFELFTESGEEIPFAILSRTGVRDLRYNPRRGHPTRCDANRFRLLVNLPEIAAFGYLRLRMKEKRYEKPFHMPKVTHFTSGMDMENQYLKVTFHSNGTIDLLNKQNGYLYSSMLLLEDSGEEGDAYVHRPPMIDRVCYSIGNHAEISMLYDTEYGAAYEIKQTMVVPEGLKTDRSGRTEATATVEVKTVVKLFAESKRLDLEVKVDNHAGCHRLRVLFPTDFKNATYSRGGQPFDITEHKIGFEYHPGVSEQPYLTHQMQDICDVSSENAGLTIAAEGIYEYECVDDEHKALALTLLRATDFLEEKNFTDIPEYSIPEAQEKRENTYRISVLPHNGDWREVYGDAMSFLCPLQGFTNRKREVSVLPEYVKPALSLPEKGEIVQLVADHMMITAVKHAEDRESLIVRVWNYGNQKQTAKLQTSFAGLKIKEAYAVNFNESREEKLTVQDGAVAFALRPWGAYTVELILK